MIEDAAPKCRLSGRESPFFREAKASHSGTMNQMSQELFSLLRCLKCRGSLEVVGEPPQELVCRACAGAVGDSARMPIVAGVPRLAALERILRR